MNDVAAAYSAGAATWAEGPMRVYGPLSDELVARCPIDLGGRTVLDLGAGTGAASAAACRAGATVVAVDHAVGMLLDRRRGRPPAVVGDARSLPFRSRSFDLVVAAFSLNHLEDVAAGLREAGRVASDYVLVSTFAADDDHPVRRATEQALGEMGWTVPAWYRQAIASRGTWDTADAVRATVERAGLVPQRVEHVLVPFPDLGPRDLVRWRLGMAQCAAFVAGQDEQALEARALDLLGEADPLVRSVIFTVARAR